MHVYCVYIISKHVFFFSIFYNCFEWVRQNIGLIVIWLLYIQLLYYSAK